MNTLGVIVLASACFTGGVLDGFSKPNVLKTLFRPAVVRHGHPPASGMVMPPVNPGLAGSGFSGNRRFTTTESQIRFVGPEGMQISWQTSGPEGKPLYLPAQLVAPASYNFRQGYIYRLRVSGIEGYAGLVLYPTIEVAPTTPATDAYLAHNPIPVEWTSEDIDQVEAGNFVTKVVYLPDPKFQDLAVAGGLYGAATVVSTRLEPGVDPILEADKRGTILLIARVGAINLEMLPGGAGLPVGVGGLPVDVGGLPVGVGGQVIMGGEMGIGVEMGPEISELPLLDGGNAPGDSIPE